MDNRLGQENARSANGQPESWERETIRTVLFEVYREQKRARFWRNIWRGVGAFLVLAVLAKGCSNDELQKQALGMSKPHSAVIRLDGVIGDGETDMVQRFREGFQAAYDNPNVRAVIIRANSPGGSPVVSNTVFNEIRRMKAAHPDIPIYAVAEDVCASGCYYIVSAADKIFADPSSSVGSIGVIGSSFDFTGLIDKIGVKRRVYIAGSNKDMGDPFVPETPEQRAIWQNMLNEVHGEFIKAVKAGRGSRLKDKQFPDVFSGRIYSGLEGRKVGLIDGFGSVYDVAREEVKAPEVVDYTPEDEITFSRLFGRRLGSEFHSLLRESALPQGW